ncbi:MAG TPA: SDR family oxidoreductase [Ktedonobacterales bacterium]|jgi:NAD(P)-dependent dehydrogenase (short-subunit alcohol dehydrogenase family)
MQEENRPGEQASAPIALVTGGSRGIGAATALALAAQGYDIVISYRNKAARAGDVVARIGALGRRAKAVSADITESGEPERLIREVADWGHGRLDLLVLNASGGLERELVAADPLYPQRINRDAQVALVDAALPIMPAGSTVVFVTSHWAHLYGRVEQLPAYEPVAATKYAGEQALRARQNVLAAAGIRLLVVTGDLIEGTITPKLLERVTPGLAGARRTANGSLPTAGDMGNTIAAAAVDSSLESGVTVVIGGTLESIPRRS